MAESDEVRERGDASQGVGLQRWALVAEIAGGVAVVLSVVYLAIQISDNNRLLRSQAHYNALELAQRPLEMMVENETLAGIVGRCDRDPERVAPSDWERCLNYYFIQYNSWEYVYYQHVDGSIPEELWLGADSFFRDQLRLKRGYQRFWKERVVAFADPFRSYVNECFAKRSD
jgi:hypothetical protein